MPEAITLEKLNHETGRLCSGLAEFVFLLGSAATPRFQAESDIDLAVFWKEGISEDKIREVHDELEDIFSRDIQIVSLVDVDPVFGRKVLETGRLLFCHENGLLLHWKMNQALGSQMEAEAKNEKRTRTQRDA